MPPQFSYGRKRDSLDVKGKCYSTQPSWGVIPGQEKRFWAAVIHYESRVGRPLTRRMWFLSVFLDLNTFFLGLRYSQYTQTHKTCQVWRAQYLVSCAETHESGREVSKTTWPKNTWARNAEQQLGCCYLFYQPGGWARVHGSSMRLTPVGLKTTEQDKCSLLRQSWVQIVCCIEIWHKNTS